METNTLFWLCIYLLIFIAGMFGGMLLQQAIIKQSMIEIGYSFTGMISNLEIDINETKMVEEIVKTIIPFINQTIQEEENDRRK